MERDGDREREQTTFHRLQRLIVGLWVWDEENYPILKHLARPDNRLTFAAPHVMLHLSGALGTIAKHIEPTGHGKPFTEEQRVVVEEALAKLFVSGLMAASLLGIEAGRLPEIMRRIMEEQASKIHEHRAEHGITPS